MADSKPLGYIWKNLPKSKREAIMQASHDRIKTIAKSGLQQYISSFFDNNGVNRAIMEATSSFGIQYISDKSFDQDQDPTQRHLQIIRFMEGVKERLPAILVVDSGMTYKPASMGLGVQGAHRFNGKVQMEFHIVREVALTIMIVTNDQETTDTLSSLLSVLFGELSNISGGSRIQGNPQLGDRWVLKLPPTFDISANVREAITDDKKDHVWHVEITQRPIFEDTFLLEEGGFTVNPLPLQTAPSPPIIEFPTSIRANQQYQMVIRNMTGDMWIVIDNPNIATFEPISMIVTPRMLGTFNIQVFGIDKDSPSKVLAQKEVTVTFN